MFIAFMVMGVALLVVSVLAWRGNRALAGSLPSTSRWRAAYRLWPLLGLLLGVVGFFVHFSYTTSERYTVYGFPFPAYALDASGHDYVGFITLPLMLINFACWFLLVHLAFWLSARRLSHGHASKGA